MSDWHLSASAAVAGLVAAARQVAGPDVHDSVAVTDSGNLEAIIVAGSNTPEAHDQPFIEHKLMEPGYTSDVEDMFTIYSEIVVRNGSKTNAMAAARDRAYLILAEWGQVIAADPTLGDAVMVSGVSGVGYRGSQVQRGAQALLLVAIECQAFTSP